MFGFLISAEVNDDAVRVKTLIDLALQKYADLPKAQLKLSIESDFDKNWRDEDMYHVTFAFAELKDFTFSLDLDQYEGVARTLTATGNRKYAGIMIQATTDKHYYSNVEGGIGYEPTGGARKMAKILETKFGVVDMTKRLADLQSKST